MAYQAFKQYGRIISVSGVTGRTQSQYFTAEYVKSLFEKISDEDSNLLGFSSNCVAQDG